MGIVIVVLIVAVGLGIGLGYLVADREDYSVKRTPPRPDIERSE